MQVLIADDESDIATLIAEVVETNFMCRTDVVENGLDAFIMCQENKYELVITDHKMPFMSGAALITAIRTRKNASQSHLFSYSLSWRLMFPPWRLFSVADLALALSFFFCVDKKMINGRSGKNRMLNS